LIWVSTWAYGSTVIDKKNNRTYSSENVDSHKIKNIYDASLVSQFFEDKDGNILFATAEHGIGKMEKDTYKVTFFENNKDDAETINDNTTFSIFQDRSGLIWCGTWKGGANIFDPRVLSFGYFKHESNKPTSISNNSIFSFCPKSDNEIYIGTNMGACVFNYDNKTFTQLPTENKDGLRHNSIIIHIYKHDDGSIWLSSFGAGIYRYYPDKNKYVNYSPSPDTNSLSFHTPVAVLKDKKERLWIGTERGLNLYNADKDNFTRIKYVKGAPGSLSSDIITSMVMQEDGKIWIGVVGAGLNLFDPETRKSRHFFNDKAGSLSKDVGVITLFIDSKGILWAGTTIGLFAINRATEEITSFADLNPLFSSMITNILEDDAGNIWFANSNGLCCFDPRTKKYVLYNSGNGLQGKQFSYEASCKHLNGKLFFGGLNGFNVFDPKQITLNTTPPQVVLTNFTTLNKPYNLGTDPSYTDEITLSYKDYFFEFDFAALDYTNPAKNTYAYKLEGFNENWVNIGTEKSATFTNLDPGTYTMLIKAANNDGFWGEPLKIKLTITPPFWRTVWFYILCIVGAGLLIYGYIKRREHQLREEKAILENKVKERTNELEIEKLKVEEAHKDIKDSINYAKRIQQAQMPTEKYFEKKLKELKK
jgi:streptogramin lyase